MKKSIMLWGGAGDLDFPAPNALQLVNEEDDRLLLDIDLTKSNEEIDGHLQRALHFGADVVLQIRLEPMNVTLPRLWEAYVPHYDNGTDRHAGDCLRWTRDFSATLHSELFRLETLEQGLRVVGRSCGGGTWGESGIVQVVPPYRAGLTTDAYLDAILYSVESCLVADRDVWLAPYGCHDGSPTGNDGWLRDKDGTVFEIVQVDAIHKTFPNDLDRIHLGYHGADAEEKLNDPESQGYAGWQNWLEATEPHRAGGYPIYWEQETVKKGGPSTVDECDETARYFETLAEIGAWRIRPDHPGAEHREGLVHFSPATMSRILQWKRGQ